LVAPYVTPPGRAAQDVPSDQAANTENRQATAIRA